MAFNYLQMKTAIPESIGIRVFNYRTNDLPAVVCAPGYFAGIARLNGASEDDWVIVQIPELGQVQYTGLLVLKPSGDHVDTGMPLIPITRLVADGKQDKHSKPGA